MVFLSWLNSFDKCVNVSQTRRFVLQPDCAPLDRLIEEKMKIKVHKVEHLVHIKCSINSWSCAWCASLFLFCFIKCCCCWNVFFKKEELVRSYCFFLLPLRSREPALPDSRHISQINQAVWLTGRQEIRSQNTINKHEAELWIKEGRLQSELNPPPHYWLQIVGDIKVASQTA